MENFKRVLAFVALTVLASQFFISRIGVSFAANENVVINEIAWAGNVDNSNAEWIELYNPSTTAVSLNGWYIEDDGSTKYTIDEGEIAPHGFFLIEDTEDAVTGITADAIIGLSLANTGDSLILKNVDGTIIDSVNGAGGMWYAGNNNDKSTMERIDPFVSGDEVANFASSSETPRAVNNNYAGGIEVKVNRASDEINQNDTFTVSFDIEDISDLYAYGMEVIYDKNIFEFISANEGEVLNSDEAETSFMYAKENGENGKIIVGNSRLVNPAGGVDGGGMLFEMEFKVLAASGTTTINFGNGNFLADSNGDIEARFIPIEITIGDAETPSDGGVSVVNNLKIALGENKYSLKISWEAPTTGADSYVVKRKMADSNFSVVGTTTNVFYVDENSIVPDVIYNYQITAVKGGVSSLTTAISGSETRGLKGDNDRSGRVDGRDLENLARNYGEEFGNEKYVDLLDTTFDGVIDGSDLIDIGANFGLKD